MRFSKFSVVLVTIAALGTPLARAQWSPDDPTATPRADVSLGYSHIQANAPPGDCGCFGVNGGYISGDFYLRDWLAVAGEITAGEANHISSLGQNLTLATYMAGPKVVRAGHRLAPYAQVLFGGARGSNSYFPSGTTYTTSASSFALSAGGGVDFNLRRYLAVRMVELQYLRTTLPNGVNDEQSHLTIGTGLVIRLGSRH
jgi:peptidoglycan-associated lipoprotein